MPERAPDRPELCLEDIDFHDRRHVSLLALLSQSNHFYYVDRTSFLNFEDKRPRVSPTGSTHGILAFERSKAVAFIIYHKFDDTNFLHDAPTHPAIEIQFHLVDKNCRRRSIGTRLLVALESQYQAQIISVEVDVTLDSEPYYTKMGYNLNFVTHPCLGGKVTYGLRINFGTSPPSLSDDHPDIKHYYKRIVSHDQICTRMETLAEKLGALMHQLPQEDKDAIVEGLKKQVDLLSRVW
jgi:ribosomal protein S18 acetylase RimI-like enzyme